MNEFSPVFPVLRFDHVARQTMPVFHPVQVRQPEQAPIGDLDAALTTAMRVSDNLRSLPKGARIAVAVGSRGIARLPGIVAHVIAAIRDMGHEPFIVPAMGSHGGGTAEGQKAMLEKLGISEESVGAPIRSSMETVNLGEVETNVDCHLDRNAAEADGIVIIARVKQHTTFDAEIESGLCKMVSVGLGKDMGARNVHLYGRRGLAELMPRIAAVSVQKARFLLGVAVVETATKDIALVEGVLPEDFAEADKRLLRKANEFMPRLPFEQLDLLVVKEIGKDISGTGMDNKVVGRVGFRGDPERLPRINCTVALAMTPASRGNGIGVGNAEIITRELANGLDLKAMYYNALTSACVLRALIPPVMETDEDAIKAGLAICWQPATKLVRACVIKSTAALNTMLVTPPLLRELQEKDLCREQPEIALEFNPLGKLVTTF